LFQKLIGILIAMEKHKVDDAPLSKEGLTFDEPNTVDVVLPVDHGNIAEEVSTKATPKTKPARKNSKQRTSDSLHKGRDENPDKQKSSQQKPQESGASLPGASRVPISHTDSAGVKRKRPSDTKPTSSKTVRLQPLVDSSFDEDAVSDSSDTIATQTKYNTAAIHNLTQTVANLAQVVQGFIQHQQTPQPQHQTTSQSYTVPNFTVPHCSFPNGNQTAETASVPGTSTAPPAVSVPGEFPLNLNDRPSHTPITYASGLPAGESLPDRIKTKIWEQKYIDFHTLLYPDAEGNYSLSLDDSGTNPTLNLLPKKKRQLTENEWCRAFDDYVAVYTRRHPQELQDLLTYGKLIKFLMANKKNWAYYDINFRRDREFSLCKWSETRIDLHYVAVSTEPRYSNNFLSTRSSYPIEPSFRTQRQPQTKTPFGYCFAYNSPTERCQNRPCRWKHTCPKCSRNHPQFLCRTYSSRYTRNHTGDNGNRSYDSNKNASTQPSYSNRNAQQSHRPSYPHQDA